MIIYKIIYKIILLQQRTLVKDYFLSKSLFGFDFLDILLIKILAFSNLFFKVLIKLNLISFHLKAGYFKFFFQYEYF